MSAYLSKEAEAIHITQTALNTDGPFTAELLAGGLSGSALIKVNTSRQTFVVRFWNRQWATYFPQDFACQIIASDACYGPQLFFANEAACITVIEYIQPETPPEFQIRLPALVDLIKKIHMGPVLPKGLDRSKELDESIEEVRKLNPQFLDLAIIKTIKESVFSLTNHNALSVPCHRDLHPGNLIYNQRRFVAIDYTWSGMDDPYVDLATLAIFNCMNSEEEQLLLQLYLGHAPSPMEVARLSFMKLSAKIFYGLELLKLAPASALSSTTPNVIPRSYLNFGRHGGTPLSPTDYFACAVSILNEVVDYSYSEQYPKDLALLQK